MRASHRAAEERLIITCVRLQSTTPSSSTTSSSYDALLLDSMQALSIAGSRSSKSKASEAAPTLVTPAATSHGSTRSSRSTGALFSPGLLAPSSRSGTSSLSSGASSAGSDSSSQLLMAFFSESGDSVPASDSSSLDARAYKLALWQAILVTVGVCESSEGVIMPGLKRPAHFPPNPLPLPTSLKACRSLIKQYIFVNIVNFKQSQIDNEDLLLFPR